MRSGIGMPERTKRVLQAIGLTRRMKTMFFPVSPHIAGQLIKVKELVAVEEVDRPLTKAEVKAERTPDPGYKIEPRKR